MKFISLLALTFAVVVGVSGQDGVETSTPPPAELVTGDEAVDEAAVTTDIDGQQPAKDMDSEPTTEPEPEPTSEPEPSSEPEPEAKSEPEPSSEPEPETKSGKEDLKMQQSNTHKTEVPAGAVPHASKQEDSDSGSLSTSSSVTAILVLAIVGFKLI